MPKAISPDTPNTPQTKPKRRWFKRCTKTVFVLVALVVIGAIIVTRPAVLTPFVRYVISQQIDARVELQEANLDWPDQLVLSGLSVSLHQSAGAPEAASTLCRATRIALDWDWSRMQLETIELDEPIVWIVEDTDQGDWLFDRIHEEEQAEEFETTEKVTPWPNILVKRGEVRRQQVTNDQITELGIIRVESDIQPELLGDTIRLSVRVQADGVSKPVELKGVIEPMAGVMRFELPRFVYGPIQNNLMPAAVAKVGRENNLGGAVEAVEVVARVQEDGSTEFDTRFQLADGHLDVDYVGRKVSLKHVQGAFKISSEGVGFEDLTGDLENITYVINGQIDGLTLDAPMQVTLKTKPFVLQQGTDIFPLPEIPEVRELYERINGTGTVSVSMRVDRTEPGQTPRIEGSLKVIDARATPTWFPYPVSGITGSIDFNNDEILLNKIHGVGPHGGQFVTNGNIGPLNDLIDFDIRIDCSDAPLDELVIPALPDSAGAFVQQHILDHLQGPTRVRSAHTRILRVGGNSKPLSYTVNVDSTGIPFHLEGIPGPLIGQSGWIHFDRYGMSFDRVQVAGPEACSAVVSGRGGQTASTGSPVIDTALSMLVLSPAQHAYVIPRKSKRGPWATTVYTGDVHLPITQQTRQMLPKVVVDSLNDFDLTGTATGSVMWTDAWQTGWRFDVAGKLTDGRATPYQAGQPLTDVAFAFDVQDEQIVLKNIQANWIDAPVSGDVHLDLQNTPAIDLKLALSSATLDPDWFAALPKNIKGTEAAVSLFESQNLQTTGDLQVKWQSTFTEPSANDLSLVYQPQTARLTRNNQSVQLDGMSGELTYDGDSLKLDQLAGSLGAGRVQVDGHATGQNFDAIDLNINGRVEQWTPSVLACLPGVIAEGGERFEVSGPVDIPKIRLWNPEPGILQVDGNITFDQTQANLAFPITSLTGDTKFSWSSRPNATHRVYFNGLDFLYDGRPIKDLRADLHTAEGEHEKVLINPITADVCDGHLNGQAWIDFGEPNTMGIDLSLTDAEWGKLMPDPQKQSTPTGSPHASKGKSRGLFSCDISLKSPTQSIDQLRGQCRWQLKNVWVIDRPVLMTVLSVASLSLPQQEAFDRLDGRFTLAGPLAHVERLAISSPQVELMGQGIINWKKQTLDLVFVPVNPKISYVTGVTEFVELVRGQIYRISVGGTLSKPKPSVTPIPAVWDVTKSLSDILGFNQDKTENGQKSTKSE